jgi:SNF2 family DNA or RNA helicase
MKSPTFDGDGALFRLALEALRLRNAHRFDPFLAVASSRVLPLPHQITAVYGELLPRQPLRFLLADDPGAGKTIMAGLYMRELLARRELERCLIVCPGSLADQWQDELHDKFQIDLDVLTRQDFETAPEGNPFLSKRLVICRLDQLSRNEHAWQCLQHPEIDWDLVIVDEAHKMSAHYWGNELKKTRRFKLGEVLGRIARNLLLMTATPHNGKEEDFQAFLGLLDPDRFEGKYREGVHHVDASDLMRRMVKEDLVHADGRKLFPERRAYTVAYHLSPDEARLYEEVTTYVRQEMNRAERFAEEQGGGTRRNSVGFALTTLQRRLASSPHAIHRSLERRRERLEERLRELRSGAAPAPFQIDLPDAEDLDELPEEELHELAEQVLDEATAARTIQELQAEILTLRDLEALALAVKRSEVDSKWRELRSLLDGNARMFDAQGRRRKLILFTEHRDTLDSLAGKLRTFIGRPEAVVTIRGGMPRSERRKVQELFLHDPEVLVLLATDAAGEGVNLQRAHLMINYDLPWNPNRLEQRFGRIHRIGQTEVCHCWNLVAEGTREGDVYLRLFQKLQAEKDALQGKVFDVLGRAFSQVPLRDLLVEAIRYGDDPLVRARLEQAIDTAAAPEHLERLLAEDALARDVLDAPRLQKIREDLDRAETTRIPPHQIAGFFLEAFQRLGGRLFEREPRRYEITHIPRNLRRPGTPETGKIERITFHKDRISPPGAPEASFVTPGHPLLAAVVDALLEGASETLRRGALLIDDADPGEAVRLLLCLENGFLELFEVDGGGNLHPAGAAPHLGYRPATPEEREHLAPLLAADWLGGLETLCVPLVQEHQEEDAVRRTAQNQQTAQAVRERLTAEITFWDRRAEELRAQEQAGKKPRMSWQRARRRVEELERRLRDRLEALEGEGSETALPPRILTAGLVVSRGRIDYSNSADMMR